MTVALGNSAAGILALLEEEDNALKAHALQKLSQVVDNYWAEIADAIPLIEELSEEKSFPQRDLAAFVASKCFFHLEEYEDALRLALGAGQYFDLNARSQYTDTIIATCIDNYVAVRAKEDPEAEKALDPRLTQVVERMFERCYAAGEFRQAMGIALEARRLDQVKECLARSTDVSAALAYCFDICKTVVSNRHFRLKVFEVMLTVYRSRPTQDYASVCQVLQMLDNHSEVSKILEQLVRGSDRDCLVAYQVAFDLNENENQKFLTNVFQSLPSPPAPAAAETAVADSTTTAEEGKTEAAASTPAPAGASPATPPPVPSGASADYWDRLSKLKLILSGEFIVDLTLDFLHRHSDSDPLVMKTIKTAVENRNSVLHHAAVISHAYMNAGTTSDTFLRENLEWLGKATNWAKFTATASLGVVHKGHVRESMNLLAPYLPQGGMSTSPYSEGGALYAMGLIHANKGSAGSGSKATMEYLRNALKNAASDETVQHGACLGIGLCGLASHDYELYEELKTVLFTDSAVAGEGAGLAIGLTLLGAGGEQRNGEIVKDLLAYAHDTKHEKIIRGCVMGIALMMYEREEQADMLIEQLIRDKDPLIRYGGMYTVAMAYAGTANNTAIRRLLHVAVSDVSDDVRRAAVTCLGFILFRTPVQVPKLVSLLAESFNPHVRYGACVAVGIACAGTAKNEAIQLLEPLLDDAVDYVRQGALLALAMVIMQESEGRNPKIASIRAKILKLITDKHVTTMTKMGAILAQGILDAGGRNVVISLQSHTGFTKMAGVVGLAIWAQHWFWYPLFNFLELSFQTTMAVGLNKDLKLPRGFELTCNAKKSAFATPKRMEEKKEEKKELVATAVLSTTAKARARQAKQDAKEKTAKLSDASGDIVMEEKETPAVDEEKKEESDAMDVDTEGTAKPVSGKKAVVKEPSVFTFTTPARVTLAQASVITLETSQRYVPVMHPAQRLTGVIMLRDTTPDEAEDVEAVKAPAAAGAENEADPPEPFEWEPPQ
ncbi:proteasome regulatory particle base subunit [Phytophthora boehmeriae]|uniref:Proteasome regulatory particle base subunit n=1 Tax=Phytophthora boehmeriae TaxID=109152 RepID=A0A8T1WR93_9STRA|nr:proteasome regulatory particle base subunit [Phytophthora boehmeriae]